MHKFKVSNRQMLRCLKTVQKNCDERDLWKGESFKSFCSNPRNVYLLKALHERDAINLCCASGFDGVDVPYYVIAKPNAAFLWIENSEKRKDRIWGFVCGVLTTVTAEFIIKTVL